MIIWIFSKLGFYSAVRTPEGKIMVRGRVREDLVHLAALIKDLGLGRPKILTTRPADYRYRMILEPETWTRVVTALAAAVDYPNFKAAVHGGDPARDRAYMDVWAAMNWLQEEKEHA